jgi:molybdenum cofactor cytidylyltransferase
MIPAIVLAAGASTRMGAPKALLPAGERTFIRRILETLRHAGIAETVVVVRPGDTALDAEIAAAGYGRAVINPRPELGQLSSLITGLDAVDRAGVDGMLVTLVDVPLINPGTIRVLCERAAMTRAPIVRAVHRGRHGHPVIFKREVFDPVRRADPAIGAKAVLRAFPVEEVDIDDPGIAEDVDTPDDYRRLITIRPANPYKGSDV